MKTIKQKIKKIVNKENLIYFSIASASLKVIAISLIIFLPPDANFLGVNSTVLSRAIPFLIPATEQKIKLISFDTNLILDRSKPAQEKRES